MAERTTALRWRDVSTGEGRGFEIAQGRLGPGRLHHCMRTIGQVRVTYVWVLLRLVARSWLGLSTVA